MPHRIEPWNGIHRMTIHGRVTLADSRQRYEEMIGLMREGRLYLLAVYAEDVEFAAPAPESLVQQKAVGDYLSHARGGALAFACGNENAFGTSRQFQMMASNSKVRIGVFREVEEAEAWVLAGMETDLRAAAVPGNRIASP